MSKILITGGVGYIGSYLEPELIRRGHTVHTMDRVRLVKENYHRGDIIDYIRMREIFKEVKPDIVYHLAGMISRKECEETQQMAITTNQIGTLNVCNLTSEYGARLIHTGSSEEYGTAFMTAGLITEDTPFGKPTSLYSFTKRAASEMIEYFQHVKDLDAVGLRLFMIYGPREDPTEYRSAIARFIYYALTNQPLPVHRNTSRGWCYIEDIVDAIATMCDESKVKSGDVFNLGCGDLIPTEDLSQMIIKMCNSKSKINLMGAEATIIPSKIASFERAHKYIGWKASTPLDKGLKNTIDYQKLRLTTPTLK